MQNVAQPYRSVLYIPGSKTRALEKAQSLPVDAIIFDLEDAVSPDEKIAARELLAQTLRDTDYGPRKCIVRVNGGDTQWGAEDLATFVEVAPDAILLPKVEDPKVVSDLAKRLKGNTTIWAMMETPRGILNAATIAAAPKVEGFVMGTNDLAKDLGSRGRDAMRTSLQMCLLAARAEGLVCVDGVYNAFKDEDGLRVECEEGRDMGFDGKTLIHPAQIGTANTVFAPSEDDLDLARRQVAAFEQAKAEGQGVAVVDGKIVENLHVETATRLLAKANAINLLEGA
ncbi:CoA ester lyase [uncultured Litoreibacter sp.]|uniref:HpcH/HpaI aldolase/citrate lyase family protein n=1 Tax=uncultured Litoreibacter sp. TaxID=1392394 RepID=UPI002623DA31|nr:CoA ester lyase [uncultured Litoreibacter sp.]